MKVFFRVYVRLSRFTSRLWWQTPTLLDTFRQGTLNMDKARHLRELMRRTGAIVAVGAHDALSARLIERAGFDAVWASGFAISAAQFALPDANVLTMTENLEIIRQMSRATGLPVIADIDNGYGNAINVIRTITEYEAAGVAAISIEDNIFPKRCSLFNQRELVSVEEHCGKFALPRAQCLPISWSSPVPKPSSRVGAWRSPRATASLLMPAPMPF
jgi:isocitrate lyase